MTPEEIQDRYESMCKNWAILWTEVHQHREAATQRQHSAHKYLKLLQRTIKATQAMCGCEECRKETPRT